VEQFRSRRPAESAVRRSSLCGRVAFVIALLGLVAGCVTNEGNAPVVDRSTDTRPNATQAAPPTAARPSSATPAAQPLHDGLPPDGHVVQSGDTLYGIAWRYGVDYRAVARLNRIEPPYRIHVGQRLMLVDPGGRAMSGPSVAGGMAPPQAVASGQVTGSTGAGAPVPAQPSAHPATSHAPPVAALPAEPSNRGFEFIPDTAGAPVQSWPPPAGATSPGAAAQSAPTAQVPQAPQVSAPAAAAGASLPATSGPSPATTAPTASVPVLPAPAASTGTPVPVGTPTLASLPVEPADEPGITAPLDEIPPETLGAPASQTATPVPQVATQPKLAPAPVSAGSGGWRWPSGGTIEKGFGNGNKGIDFHLDPGKPVIAAGGGEVVYAGNGLGGFRNLVIVKHDQRFLSAYSLNWPIAVKEGQRLDAGSTIAAAGGSGSGTLRFEIRRDGQPVDPASIIKR
jgi:lipoprotein NlpD